MYLAHVPGNAFRALLWLVDKPMVAAAIVVAAAAAAAAAALLLPLLPLL